MAKESKGREDLVNFFQKESSIPRNELENILEIQKIAEQSETLEETPQIYKLQVTSNW
jgi:hypothetical protein